MVIINSFWISMQQYDIKFRQEQVVKGSNLLDGKYKLVQKPIGSGGYAKIYEAECMETSKKVAIKKTNINELHKILSSARGLSIQKINQHIINESTNLEQISSPYIVEYFDNFKSKDGLYIYLVMDFLDGCSLKDHIIESVSNELETTQSDALYLARDICFGLEALNRKKIVHRDLHPENIFRHKERWVIIDMGVSKIVDKKSKTPCTDIGCLEIQAPEIINKKSNFDKADLWSLGVVLFYFLTKDYFVTVREKESREQRLKNIEKKIGIEFEQPYQDSKLSERQISPQMRNLLNSLLQIDPVKRTTLYNFKKKVQELINKLDKKTDHTVLRPQVDEFQKEPQKQGLRQ